jgi:cellulose synthase/poly-beta-1,6-N-acetylglucosamine synthase-like glycosyltransferase
VATIASVLLALVQGVLLFCLGHQTLLALASIRQPEPSPASGGPRTRFAVAVPAHDEASVLPATLAQLQTQAYPETLFDVHVVADHCTDNTAEVVEQGGGTVHERNSLPRGRKAYALQWLLERLLRAEPPYDAVAIFDADSLVETDFLQAMDGHLQAGEAVLQGQHLISNPEDSLLAAVAAVDMRLNNRLRNQSRRNLGFSCRLMGDAMVLDTRVLRAHGWLGESLTEDREYGYELLLRGVRVCYAPEARSYGQAASSWKQAEPQRLRWYRGVVGMQRRLAGRLLAGALRSRSLALFDGALELLMPSYTFLTAASAINLGLVVGLMVLLPSVRGLLGVTGSALLLAAWGLYPLVGLLIDRAPAWAFRALLLGPAYLIWRLWISMLVRLRGDRIGWIRTRRREETKRI